MIRPPPSSTLFPSTPLFRSPLHPLARLDDERIGWQRPPLQEGVVVLLCGRHVADAFVRAPKPILERACVVGGRPVIEEDRHGFSAPLVGRLELRYGF